MKELSIIIPTYNERENVQKLLLLLEEALKGIDWEVVFVDDDSPDGTAQRIQQMAQQKERIRCLHRIGRRGLASACVEGMLSASADYLAVMDADMQHDETLLPKMLQTLKQEKLDIVIGSRYVSQGSLGQWSQKRAWISRFATKLGQAVIKIDLKDPLSGFFMLRRSFFQKVVHRLTAKGFKILLDVCSSAQEPIRFKELPYTFRQRHYGKSKLDTMIAWEYLLLLIDKTVGQVIPVRFVLFAFVGFIGAIVHLFLLGIFLKLLLLSFAFSQMIATLVVMTASYILDNVFIYRDMKLDGKNFIKGLLLFSILCSIGAIINIHIAIFLYNHNIVWWLAGLLGALVGAVWNYAISTTYIWGLRKRLKLDSKQ